MDPDPQKINADPQTWIESLEASYLEWIVIEIAAVPVPSGQAPRRPAREQCSRVRWVFLHWGGADMIKTSV